MVWGTEPKPKQHDITPYFEGYVLRAGGKRPRGGCVIHDTAPLSLLNGLGNIVYYRRVWETCGHVQSKQKIHCISSIFELESTLDILVND